MSEEVEQEQGVDHVDRLSGRLGVEAADLEKLSACVREVVSEPQPALAALGERRVGAVRVANHDALELAEHAADRLGGETRPIRRWPSTVPGSGLASPTATAGLALRLEDHHQPIV